MSTMQLLKIVFGTDFAHITKVEYAGLSLQTVPKYFIPSTRPVRGFSKTTIAESLQVFASVTITV